MIPVIGDYSLKIILLEKYLLFGIQKRQDEKRYSKKL
jgi:hypothetical protein